MALPDRRLHAPSRWIAVDRLHPLVPRHTKRFRALYCEAVEREFGRLKHEWALLPLRVRRIECVRLHANLSILTKLAVRFDKGTRCEGDSRLRCCRVGDTMSGKSAAARLKLDW